MLKTTPRRISHNDVLEMDGIEGSGVNLNYDGYNFVGWFVGEVGADGVIGSTGEQLTTGSVYKFSEQIKVVAKFTER